VSTLPPPPPPEDTEPYWFDPADTSYLWHLAAPEEAPRPRWLVPLGVGIGAVFLAGVVAAFTIGDDGPDHPDSWDPRVADLAAYVEDERDLDFDHPVHVDFLTPAEYSAASTGDPDPAAEEQEREEYDDYAGQLRALGVASGDLDLYEAFNRVVDSGTLAFYDPVEERIHVRGTEMTVGLEVTLVHELTHALQDQSFDFDRLRDPTLDAGASTSYRALVEGDAVRVENAYIQEELTEEEREAYDEEYAQELADSESATSDVPPFIEARFGAPYALGQPFVTMLFNQGGNDRVDEAFEAPPDREEHVFDPASYAASEQAEEIDLEVPDDVDVLEDGSFGAVSWYLVLAERIDPKVAFEAALGWNGDAFRAYERDGAVCVEAAFVGDTDADEDEMRSALEAWAASMTGTTAEVTDADGHPALKACDPGASVDLELSGRSATSLYLPNLWGQLIADASGLLDPGESRCYARAVLADLTFEEVTDPEGAAFAGDEFQQSMGDALEQCR
jgi:hypothetical protein